MTGDTLKEAIATEVERQLRLSLRVEMCVVLAIQRHAFEDDKLTNTVTVKLRDNIGYYTPCAQVDRQRVFQIQDYMGHHYGHPTNPRVGDLLWVFFYQNEKAIILGACPSWEQLPVCRDNDSDQVYKFCQHELPTAVDQCGDITGAFPEPHWPVCFKFFGKDRSSMLISECPLGEATPSCEVCKDLDDITNLSKSLKFYPKDHQSHPDRVRWSHKKGQFIQMERDGSILIRDSTGSFICLKGEDQNGGILIRDKAGSYIALNGLGALTVRAADAGSHNLHNTCCACACKDCTSAEDDMGGVCSPPHYSSDAPTGLEPEVGPEEQGN